MKILLAFTGISLALNLLNGPANLNSIKSKLCKTWVAYKVTMAEPMMKRKYTRKLDKQEFDSIQINNDGSYYRNCNMGTYKGTWTMNADSTNLFVLPSSPVRRNGGWLIINLSDSSLYLRHSWGKEGESSIFKFKPIEEAKN
jgi:hypothetical protein